MSIRALSAAPSTSSSVPPVEPPPPRGGQDFRDLFRDAVGRISSGDRELARLVASGSGATPIETGELLRLQASVYRTSHELDLVGRIVDKATQAVKTTLQNQS